MATRPNCTRCGQPATMSVRWKWLADGLTYKAGDTHEGHRCDRCAKVEPSGSVVSEYVLTPLDLRDYLRPEKDREVLHQPKAAPAPKPPEPPKKADGELF